MEAAMLHLVLASLLIAGTILPTSLSPAEPFLAPLQGSKTPEHRLVVGFPLMGDIHLVAVITNPATKMGYINLSDAKGRLSALQLRTPNDLRGKVDIRTISQALGFARLFTAPDTWALGWVYHTDTKGIRALEVLTNSEAPGRVYGVVSKTVARRLKLEPVAVKWKTNHWVIERNLIILSLANEYRIYRSRETIYPDGRYTHRITRFVPNLGDTHLVLPPLLW
jgi:hypothetical protein